MIVCSCAVISDADIETVLVELLREPNAPLPTPGLVYKRLAKKMTCCGCAPLAVSTIYEKIDELARRGTVAPYACTHAQGRILRAAGRPARRLIARRAGRRGRGEIRAQGPDIALGPTPVQR
jgi:hypothetical protein